MTRTVLLNTLFCMLYENVKSPTYNTKRQTWAAGYSDQLLDQEQTI